MPQDVFTDREPVISESARQTFNLGADFARQLKPGNVLALYGTLGVGKTQFVKGICSAFGIPADAVTSPTFTIVNEYNSTDQRIYHFDAYRIEHISEFFELGYQDYFYGNGLCLIEWPDRVEELLPNDVITIRFTHLGGDLREIVLVG